jgi:hypothetical protein
MDVLTSSAPLSLLARYSTVVLGAPPSHDTQYLSSVYLKVKWGVWVRAID